MIIFCLENLRSVYNVGSIFRTAEGFGFNNFILIGTTPTPIDKNGNKRKDFIKTALGSEDNIDWQYFENTDTLMQKYNNTNTKIISIELDSRSEDIKNLNQYIKEEQKQDQDILIFLGSETEGVSKQILNISDKIYHIQMYGVKESFNVSVASGIMMYLIKNN